MTEKSSYQMAPVRDVFVSYASQDVAVADAIVATLEKSGSKCWIAPRDVTPGSQYADEIVGAINDAKILVLVLSQHAIDSPHVGKEIERASSKRRRIIGLRTDAVPLTRSFEYFLSESQWIDVAALGMPGALAKLTQAVGQGLAPSSWISPGLGADADNPADRKRRPSYLTIQRVVAAAVFLGVAAIVANVVVRYWPSKQGAAPVVAALSDQSIAVLPFADMSEKKDQEYFSDGLSEDLITALSQLPGLKVIGRTSAFKFRDSKDDSHTIGKKLGVAHLLEGSVRHAGDTVRVSAELIDVSDGSTQWSTRYDRPYKDLFGLQDDLTHAVAGALKAHLMPGESASVPQAERPPSGNLEAYNALLEGKYYLARDTDADTRKAIERFARATELDADYAFAWSLLSRAWTNLGGFHVNLASAPEAFAKARPAVNTALSLTPNLAGAHIARGWLLETADLDWSGAEAEYRRAFELSPRSGDAAASLAHQLANFGHLNQAIELTRQALATDPMNSKWHAWLATYLSASNRLEEAGAAIHRAIELQPGGVWLHAVLTNIEIRQGNPQAALAAAQQEPPGFFRDAALVKALQSGNNHAAAETALNHLLDMGPSWDPYDVAQIYAMRNDADKTFEWLDRAWSYRDPAVHNLPYDPFIRRFKDDPRFIAYCRKVGLPVPGDAAGANG
jgi:TolB-like protein/Flp pilus assembly protein TadD